MISLRFQHKSLFCGNVKPVWYYQPHRRSDKALRQRIVEIAAARVRYGVNRIHILLRREGWKDNKSAYTGSTKKKASISEAKGHVEARELHIEWKDRNLIIYTNIGQWIL